MEQQIIQSPSVKYWKRGLKLGAKILVSSIVIFILFVLTYYFTGGFKMSGQAPLSFLDTVSVLGVASLIVLWWWFIPAILFVPWMIGLVMDVVRDSKNK